MTPEENKILDLKFEGIRQFMELEFRAVNSELSHIKEQTTKTNGRVNKLEEKVSTIEKHPANCEAIVKMDERLDTVEKVQTKNTGAWKGISLAVGGVVALIELVFHIIK